MALLPLLIVLGCGFDPAARRAADEALTPAPLLAYDRAMADTAAVTNSKKLLARYGTWLRKYTPGMPVGFMAAIMNHESSGNFATSGDATLGEVGFFQIAKDVPGRFGLPASARAIPEVNVAIAGLEYAQEAVLWYLRARSLGVPVALGSADNWMLARLAFAVGRAGSYKLGDLAIASGYTRASPTFYGAIQQYVGTHGAPSLGSQSPEKVARRVASIPVLWATGQAVEPGAPAVPTRIPNPPGYTYTLPASIASYVARPLPLLAVAIAAGAGLTYYLWRQA